MIRGHRSGFKLEISRRRKRRRSRNSGASGIGDWPRLGCLRGGRMDANTHEKPHADESEAHSLSIANTLTRTEFRQSMQKDERANLEALAYSFFHFKINVFSSSRPTIIIASKFQEGFACDFCLGI